MADIGRNDSCPCGSGKKYKRCHGALTVTRARPPRQETDSTDPVGLGLRYLMGQLTDRPHSYGVKLIEQAAEAGDARALYLAATISSCSFFRPRDWEQAFDYLERAAEAGHESARSSLRIIAAGPAADPVEGDDWAGMRGAIDLEAWLSTPVAKTIRKAPRIRVVENFVSPAVCDWLIEQARGRLSRATIYDKKTGGTIEDGRRTNSQCDLGVDNSGVLTFIVRGRISAITQRPDAAMEIAKILHYEPGETFAIHFDYLNPNEPAYRAELGTRGQRTDTFLIYLNDDFEGGETHFPKIELSHRGKAGDAIWFLNVNENGRPDENTMHAGLPPTAGVKWLFSQWIRQYPDV